MRRKVPDDAQSLWSQAQSPPKTPANLRGHVNAMSPLMEVCQNTGRSTGETRRCRPEASAQLAFAASPSSAAATSSSAAGAEDFFHPPALGGSPAHEVRVSSSHLTDSCARVISAWEDAAQVPPVPPVSPASPDLGLRWRRELHERMALKGFLHGLPTSLYVALQEDCSGDAPPRRSLLACLEETETEEASAGSQAPSAAFLLPQRSSEGASAEASLLELSMEGEVVNEVDELAQFRIDTQNHQTVWPAQTLLDMEDHLSRSYDLAVFWFFETRERANSASAHDRKPPELLSSIPEYPPSWSPWQIESARSRSAMRQRKQSVGRQRPDGQGAGQ